LQFLDILKRIVRGNFNDWKTECSKTLNTLAS
jgi:hypothetical protein